MKNQLDKILSGHQPVYLPSLHLFNKIYLSDEFMFVGHCQYVKKSWHTRNNIQQGGSTRLLSVPVLTTGRGLQPINETRLDGNAWKRKHLRSIEISYKGYPYFEMYFDELREIILREWTFLGELNTALITAMVHWLDIKTKLCTSEDYDITGQSTDMLISMCKATHCKSYLSNEGARAYVDEDRFALNGLQHLWQIYQPVAYSQRGADLPNLTVLDLLFNEGPTSHEVIKASGHIVEDARID